MVDSSRKKLINRVFPEQTLTDGERAVVNRLLDYLNVNGTLPTSGKKDKRAEVLTALGETAKKCCGYTLQELMNENCRKWEKVLYRTFCWERYRNFFPLDSSKKIRKMFGCSQASSTIRTAMIRLRDRVIYDPDAARRYREFCKKLDYIIQDNKFPNQ